MARASSVEACLICGELPCTCMAKKKQVAKPRKAQPKPVVLDSEPVVEEDQPMTVQNRSMLDRMRARATASSPVLPERKPAKPVAPPPDPEPDANLIAAVRLLNDAFQIEGEDLAPFKKYLEAKPSVGERAALWKRSRPKP